MRPGEIRWAFVEFEDQAGGKTRPVLVLRVVGATLFVVAGTSKWKDHLHPLLDLDEGHPDWNQSQLTSATYFYLENLRELQLSAVARFCGRISRDELQRIVREINAAGD